MNYYAVEVPSQEKLNEIQELIKNQQFSRLKEIVENIPRYHIGKQSYGWQFLFAPHTKIRQGFWNSGREVSPWENTLESITEYLSRPSVIIEDEEGRHFTCEEFFNNIQLYNDSNTAINLFQWYSLNPPTYRFDDCILEVITEEGLRFSTDEDFS